MAFLLIVPRKIIEGEMAFRLAMVWACPHQAHLSSLDEVARKLTLIIDLTDNWAYTYVWLNGDTQHVPLSNKGYFSAMVDGVSCWTACGCLCQLEVCRLLQYRDQVVYPEGLNGGLGPVLTLLSGTLAQGMDTLGKSTREPSFLLVELSQVTLGDCMLEASAPHGTSTLPSPFHLTMECPPKTDSHISCPLRSKSSFHGLCWTPPVRCWGTPSQRVQHLQPWELHLPPEQKTSPSW